MFRGLCGGEARYELQGALQDYRRAIVVGGQHTHGKGTVQTIIDLNENIPLLHLRRYDDLGALKATIQKFYRIDGGSTQYKGVVPDVILPSLFQNLKSGEQYLDYSLPWDQDEPVRYDSYSDKVGDLQTIIDRSKARIKESADLVLIEEEAARAATRSEQTVIELNLESMRAKRAEEKQAREKVGAHYSRLEEDDLEDPGVIDELPESPESGPDEDWLSDLAGDPYVTESEMIINDLVHQLRK